MSGGRDIEDEIEEIGRGYFKRGLSGYSARIIFQLLRDDFEGF